MIYSLDGVDSNSQLAMTFVFCCWFLGPWSSPAISFGNSFLRSEKARARGEYVQQGSNGPLTPFCLQLSSSLAKIEQMWCKRIVSVWNERMTTVRILCLICQGLLLGELLEIKIGTHGFSSIYSPTKKPFGSRIHMSWTDHGCDYLNFPRPFPASAEIDLF